MATYLDFNVKTKEEFKQWILISLGYPQISIELTDDQLNICIEDALEIYTKYVHNEERFYKLDLTTYEEDKGIKLPDNVVGLFSMDENGSINTQGINTLFSLQNAMLNSGMWPPILGGGTGNSGSWVDYYAAMSYLELTSYMTGSVYTFDYNPRTKYLRLTPDPVKNNSTESIVVIGVFTISPEDQIYGENWVKRMALAKAKMILGNIYSKYSGVQMVGGGQINSSIKGEGIEEYNKLLEEVKGLDVAVGFFLG